MSTNNFDEKICKALYQYISRTDFRDITYYILVFNRKPLNCYELYRLELNDSKEDSWDDLIITYAMDYDEGQDIDIKMVFSESDILNCCINFYVNSRGMCYEDKETNKK